MGRAILNIHHPHRPPSRCQNNPTRHMTPNFLQKFSISSAPGYTAGAQSAPKKGEQVSRGRGWNTVKTEFHTKEKEFRINILISCSHLGVGGYVTSPWRHAAVVMTTDSARVAKRPFASPTAASYQTFFSLSFINNCTYSCKLNTPIFFFFIVAFPWSTEKIYHLMHSEAIVPSVS